MIRDLAAELEALLATDQTTRTPPPSAEAADTADAPGDGGVPGGTSSRAHRYLYEAPPPPEVQTGAVSGTAHPDAAVSRAEGEAYRPLRGAETQGRIAEMLAARQAERLRRDQIEEAPAPADPEPEYAPVPENWGQADTEAGAMPGFHEDDGWTMPDSPAETPAAAAPYALDRQQSRRPGVRRVVFSAASVLVLLAASAVAGQYVIGTGERSGPVDPDAPAAADADDAALAATPDDEDVTAADEEPSANPQRVEMAGAAATWDEPSEARAVGNATGSSGSTIGAAQAAESGSGIRNVTPGTSDQSEEGDPAIPSAEEALRPDEGAGEAAVETQPESSPESAFGDPQAGAASQPAEPAGQTDPDAGDAAASSEPTGSDTAPTALNSAVGPATLARVTTYVNMRNAPDNDGEVITVIPAEADIDLVDCDVWCEIVYDGQQGWVYQDFVETGESVSAADS